MMRLIEASTEYREAFLDLARIIEKKTAASMPGKIADVLIVTGDPLQDLRTLSNVHYVIHNSEVIRKP